MRRLVVIFLVLVLLAAGATVAGILLSDGPTSPLGGPTVLVWRVQGPVPEQRQPELITLSSRTRTGGVADLYRGFLAARSDPSVRGIALYVRDTGFGLAKAQEFRRQLRLLSEEGKFVECYFETVGEGTNGTLGYYLATACDHVFLSPTGTVNLLGLYAATPFFRGTLEKLQVEPEFTAEGEYKSAAEQFTRTEYSGAAREALQTVIDGAYAQVLEAVSRARSLPVEEVERLVDTAPHTADEALEAGLVDELLYPDEFRDRVEELAGGEPRLVHLDTFGPRSRLSGSHRIAVVVAAGTIVRGAGGAEPWTEQLFVGSDDLTPVLRDLAENRSVEAVVLRVDSPGGSALASELILRELQLLAEEKPVVVSMSDLAASGGYYISSRAHQIVAEPATITGSIGVVTGRFATETFQRELLGITYDAVARGNNAGLWAAPQPLEPEQLDQIRALNATVYRTFLEHVAAGREMSLDQVEQVARGRVWIGTDAHRLGLVDELGGLDRAVELAAEAAGLPEGEPRNLVYFPQPKGWMELLFEERRPLLPATVRTLLKQLAPPVRGALHAPPEVRALARPF